MNMMKLNNNPDLESNCVQIIIITITKIIISIANKYMINDSVDYYYKILIVYYQTVYFYLFYYYH